MGNGGSAFFAAGKMEVDGDNIIRKYTFECGARPTGTASLYINKGQMQKWL